ncbi:hypothetical protein UY3_14315 [Chelonia mydas]|uniref:Uncharacterized protein n=1 Tax=Chelonia mydas TaxID=8469 RepID=M7B8T7_CHEMY|nr:hypothetical protein UY3_14315 [Chelonia mydas]
MNVSFSNCAAIAINMVSTVFGRDNQVNEELSALAQLGRDCSKVNEEGNWLRNFTESSHATHRDKIIIDIPENKGVQVENGHCTTVEKGKVSNSFNTWTLKSGPSNLSKLFAKAFADSSISPAGSLNSSADGSIEVIKAD